jgi:hypothetical protein
LGRFGTTRRFPGYKHRDVSAFRQLNHDRVGDAGTLIIFSEAGAEAARLHSDDGIDPGIIVGWAIEDLHADYRFFYRLARKGALDDEAEERRQAAGVGETGAGDHGFQFP